MTQNNPTEETARRTAESTNDDATSGALSGSTDAAAATTKTAPARLEPRVLTALRAANEKKALDIVVLDLRPLASFTDYFLITSGTNARQVQAIADGILEQLRKEGTRAERVEGFNSAEWVLLDYGDFVCHIFEDKARRFYDLERLWREAARVPLPPELRGETVQRSSDDAA